MINTNVHTYQFGGKKRYTHEEVKAYKMKKLNYLKIEARKRAFNGLTPLTKEDVMREMGQIKNGQVAEIASFALLGLFQANVDFYFSIYTSETQDRNHADVSLRLKGEDTVYIDLKSSRRNENNNFAWTPRSASIYYDFGSGFLNLCNILEHVKIDTRYIRLEMGRVKYETFVSKCQDIWDYYMKQFSINI